MTGSYVSYLEVLELIVTNYILFLKQGERMNFSVMTKGGNKKQHDHNMTTTCSIVAETDKFTMLIYIQTCHFSILRNNNLHNCHLCKNI